MLWVLCPSDLESLTLNLSMLCVKTSSKVVPFGHQPSFVRLSLSSYSHKLPIYSIILGLFLIYVLPISNGSRWSFASLSVILGVVKVILLSCVCAIRCVSRRAAEFELSVHFCIFQNHTHSSVALVRVNERSSGSVLRITYTAEIAMLFTNLVRGHVERHGIFLELAVRGCMRKMVR